MARQKRNNELTVGKLISGGKKKPREVILLCRNIRRYREQLGMEQKELSRRLGMADSTVGNWETGYSKPTVEVLLPLSKELGVTLYKLFGLNEPIPELSAAEKLLLDDYRDLSRYHRETVNDLIANLKRAEEIEDVPELTKLVCFEKQLAAGIGDPSELYGGGEPIYLYPSEIVNKADFVFTVNGESMEPEYHSGDMVLIQKFPDCGELDEGEVGAFMVGNEAYIKEYRKDGLHSLNPKYRPMHFNDEEKVYLIGRVTGLVDSGDLPSEQDVKKYLSAYSD